VEEVHALIQQMDPIADVGSVVQDGSQILTGEQRDLVPEDHSFAANAQANRLSTRCRQRRSALFLVQIGLRDQLLSRPEPVPHDFLPDASGAHVTDHLATIEKLLGRH